MSNHYLTIERDAYDDACGTDGGKAFLNFVVYYNDIAQTHVLVEFGTDNNLWNARLSAFDPVVMGGKEVMSPAFFSTHLELAAAAWGFIASKFDGSNGEFYSTVFEDENGDRKTLTWVPA